MARHVVAVNEDEGVPTASAVRALAVLGYEKAKDDPVGALALEGWRTDRVPGTGASKQYYVLGSQTESNAGITLLTTTAKKKRGWDISPSDAMRILMLLGLDAYLQRILKVLDLAPVAKS